MREVDEQVDVTLAEGRPRSFRWRGHDYEVSEVLHTWSEKEGGWWTFRKRVTRRYYRVHAQGYRRRITAELHAVDGDDSSEWRLAAVYD